jgi:hypothetical protein
VVVHGAHEPEVRLIFSGASGARVLVHFRIFFISRLFIYVKLVEVMPNCQWKGAMQICRVRKKQGKCEVRSENPFVSSPCHALPACTFFCDVPACT